jgi:predicted GIY-YIG superfamily endonuclease
VADAAIPALSQADTPRFAHRVYVIELDPAVLGERRFRARNPNYVDGMPCVYVGMTGLSVEERFANHRAGYKSNRYAHHYGLRLLPDLYECFNPMPFEAARQMEKDLADELQENGYAVWQG